MKKQQTQTMNSKLIRTEIKKEWVRKISNILVGNGGFTLHVLMFFVHI